MAAPRHPLEKLRQIIGASLKAYREGRQHPRLARAHHRRLSQYRAAGRSARLRRDSRSRRGALIAWFGMRLDEAVAALNEPGQTPAKVRAFKYILTLLISVRAPSVFLVEERDSLEEKVDQFTRLMARAGIIDWELAAQAARNADPLSTGRAAAAATVVKQKQSRQRDPHQYDGRARRHQSLRSQPAALASRQHLRCLAAKAGDRVSEPSRRSRISSARTD